VLQIVRYWVGLLLVPLILGGSVRALAAVVCPSGSVLEGVDVSEFDGSIDWTQVAASGRAFAFARLGDGSAFVDPTFDTNYAAIKAAGLIRGAYQFFEPAQDPVAQANFLLSKIGALRQGDLPPVLDVEATGGQSPATIVANIQTWISTVQQATGVTPMIYTAAGFWDGSVGSSAFMADPLFVANFGATCPDLPTGWMSWQFWQYSDTGSVPGIADSVDLDRFNGSMSDLVLLAAGSPLSFVGAVSRKVHGSAGTFDLTLSVATTNPTTEPRRGPTQTIVFTFNKAISGATVAITEGTATAAAPTFSGNDVIVGLTGVNNQQYVTIALTNVSSVDGGSGGSASVRVGFLVGDVNQNRVVTVSDLVLANQQIAHVVTPANFLKDVNANGILTVSDKLIINNNITKALPAP
jgi:GH25 family lysozyme M1 (1,4-beta-N-acetylmuramidase)